MTKTKTPPKPVVYGDHLPITAHQKKTILHNCAFNMDVKDEWVQWVTGDVKQTSLRSLTQAQAVKIIRQQTGDTSPPSEGCLKGGVVNKYEDNWGLFDKKNSKHERIQANLRTANIVVKSEKWGEVADMLGWFNRFLKSSKSPVKKPLKKMTPKEVSKIIEALDGVAIWKNSI